jgi:hypothetical protein
LLPKRFQPTWLGGAIIFNWLGWGFYLWRRASPHCVPQMPSAQISEPQHWMVASQIPPSGTQGSHVSGLGNFTTPLLHRIGPMTAPSIAGGMHSGWQLSPLSRSSLLDARGQSFGSVSWGRDVI